MYGQFGILFYGIFFLGRMSYVFMGNWFYGFNMVNMLFQVGLGMCFLLGGMNWKI